MSIYAIADVETAKLIADALYDSINVCNDVIFEINANIKEFKRKHPIKSSGKKVEAYYKEMECFKTKRQKLMKIQENILEAI